VLVALLVKRVWVVAVVRERRVAAELFNLDLYYSAQTCASGFSAQPFRLFVLFEPGSGEYPAGWRGGSHNAPQFALLTMREPGNCGGAEEYWTSVGAAAAKEVRQQQLSLSTRSAAKGEESIPPRNGLSPIDLLYLPSPRQILPLLCVGGVPPLSMDRAHGGLCAERVQPPHR